MFPGLLAALAMLAMVPATLDEVVAMLQFLRAVRSEGKPLWRAFWRGAVIEGGERDERLTRTDWGRPQEIFMRWLASNWHLLLASVLGAWLMSAPDVLGSAVQRRQRRLTGALVVTVALIATAEVGRACAF